MFDLAAINPAWRGQLIDEREAPLRAGIASLGARLASKAVALVVLVTRFDFDSTWERVETILELEDQAGAVAAAPALVAQAQKSLLSSNPTWRVLTTKPHLRSVLPATGTPMPDPGPEQVFAVKVGDDEMYDAAYIRAYAVVAEAPATLLATLLAEKTLSEPLIKFLMELGSAQEQVRGP